MVATLSSTGSKSAAVDYDFTSLRIAFVPLSVSRRDNAKIAEWATSKASLDDISHLFTVGCVDGWGFSISLANATDRDVDVMCSQLSHSMAAMLRSARLQGYGRLEITESCKEMPQPIEFEEF